MKSIGNSTRQDYFFVVFLLLLISAFSIYFLSFTLFDGFATFSNDAASYVLLARKWSPYFVPSDAELYTWPLQTLPPGFSWALAITGASESLWSSHLFVSICMLGSLVIIGWIAYREVGWLIGCMLVLAFCLLPGVTTSSMGILSENLYLLLSLAVLWTYSNVQKNENANILTYLLLLVFLTSAILTRTIGVSLVAALFIAALLDKKLTGNQKLRVYLIAASSLVLWRLWDVVGFQPGDMTYGYYLKHYFGWGADTSGVFTFLWQNFKTNSSQILSSWGHYLSLNHTNFWFFIFSYILLVFCLFGLILRLRQRKLDALYIVFYLFILLIWPHPGEMTRFLHPIVFLLLLQPIVFFMTDPKIGSHMEVKYVLAVVVLAFTVNSTFIQLRMKKQREAAQNSSLDLSHSYEFYDFPSQASGIYQAISFATITKYIKNSVKHVQPNDVVATVKHVNYSLLTDRRAVNLSTIVSDIQQFCNLKVKDVDLVFLSDLTTGFNREGSAKWEKYKEISSNIWKESVNEQMGATYSVAIDKEKLNSKLEESGYDCQSYQAQR